MELNINVRKNMDLGLHTANQIIKSVPSLINQITIIENKSELVILTDSSKINNLLSFLKNHLNFQALQDLFCVDYMDYIFFNNIKVNKNINERFQINYYLLNIDAEMRILIKVNLNENTLIDSATNIFNSASWLEREVWDLFGVYFRNHPDLRRILTDYGFEGHALRKDFPLSGYTEIMYTTELKKITMKPLELTQEYRAFDFVSPWDIKKT